MFMVDFALNDIPFRFAKIPKYMYMLFFGLQVQTEPAFEWDDKQPRICWRGDGQYFVVSSINSQTGTY